MKKPVALLLAILLMLSTVTAFAEVYKDKPTVKAVQQALNDAGYNCGTPDGSAGKKTKAAITQFQTDKGLEVTGQIDDALLEALGIATRKPEAQPEEQVESADEAASTEGSSTVNWDDPNQVAQLYHAILLETLTARGVDVENENIGLEAYGMTKAQPVYAEKQGWQLHNADKTLELNWGYMNYPSMEIDMIVTNVTPEEERKVAVNFLESAVISTVTTMMNAYLNPSEEVLAYEDKQLSSVPDREGTVELPVSSEEFGDYVIEFDYPSGKEEMPNGLLFTMRQKAPEDAQ